MTALTALWLGLGLPESALDAVTVTGSEPQLPSGFRVGTLAATSIAAVAAAANEIWRLRGGEHQTVFVDMAHAAAEFRSERYLRVNGAAAPELWDPIAGAYRCGDGRWVRVHTNFPLHRKALVTLLGCADDKASVADAALSWRAEDLETRAVAAGALAFMQRSFEEWDRHPQGVALGQEPLIAIERIGDAPPRKLLGDARRPLDRLKVLDLTRIIAGPVGGRALAAHGAEVMRITSPKLPSIPPLVMDSGRGKLSAALDLTNEEGRAGLERLVAQSDVFLQGYRPGGLAALGFGPERLAELRPGLIHVSLSAFGFSGPWKDRRGFDSLVQTATGFNYAEARAFGSEGPRPLPCQALDHASGYLLALGTLTALLRQLQEGGSWRVRVSLARTGLWLRALGTLPEGLSCPEPEPADSEGFLEKLESGFGELTVIRHAAKLSHTPARWERPSMPLGSHPPVWPV
jgi:crotonobetainyl-CoA:carnitine CoA-transferase CaiB-like acyl-CoA transferase